MFKLDLEKAEKPEIKLPKSTGSSKKQESSRKTSTSAFACICVQSCLTFCNPMDCSPRHFECCTQYASKCGKLNSGHRTGKGQFSFQSQKKGNAKECSNYSTIALISHASKVMLKILQARLQQYVNRELPDVQAGFRKGRGTRDQIANICWII